jgi:hypothetical protein
MIQTDISVLFFSVTGRIREIYRFITNYGMNCSSPEIVFRYSITGNNLIRGLYVWPGKKNTYEISPLSGRFCRKAKSSYKIDFRVYDEALIR